MTNKSGRRILLTAAAAILIAPLGRAQAPGGADAAKEFEVASIKPSDPNGHGVRVEMSPGGRFTATGVTVKFLLQQAYGVKDFQITGGPNWIGSEKYDITAKAAEGEGNVTPNQLAPMMQSTLPDPFKLRIQALLADRFKMTFHRETKEQPVYALVVGKNGPKLKESAPEEDGGASGGASGGTRRVGTQIRMSRGQITAQRMSMGMLAIQLSNRLGRNVLDKTGLTGSYDLTLEFTPEGAQPMGPREGGGDAAAPPDSASPSIFTAVQEQLGLKLESQKGPVEMFVLDRIEKATEN